MCRDPNDLWGLSGEGPIEISRFKSLIKEVVSFFEHTSTHHHHRRAAAATDYHDRSDDDEGNHNGPTAGLAAGTKSAVLEYSSHPGYAAGMPYQGDHRGHHLHQHHSHLKHHQQQQQQPPTPRQQFHRQQHHRHRRYFRPNQSTTGGVVDDSIYSVDAGASVSTELSATTSMLVELDSQSITSAPGASLHHSHPHRHPHGNNPSMLKHPRWEDVALYWPQSNRRPVRGGGYSAEGFTAYGQAVHLELDGMPPPLQLGPFASPTVPRQPPPRSFRTPRTRSRKHLLSAGLDGHSLFADSDGSTAQAPAAAGLGTGVAIASPLAASSMDPVVAPYGDVLRPPPELKSAEQPAWVAALEKLLSDQKVSADAEAMYSTGTGTGNQKFATSPISAPLATAATGTAAEQSTPAEVDVAAASAAAIAAATTAAASVQSVAAQRAGHVPDPSGAAPSTSETAEPTSQQGALDKVGSLAASVNPTAHTKNAANAADSRLNVYDFQIVMLIESRRLMQLYFAKKFLQLDLVVNVHLTPYDAAESLRDNPGVYGLIFVSYQELKKYGIEQALGTIALALGRHPPTDTAAATAAAADSGEGKGTATVLGGTAGSADGSSAQQHSLVVYDTGDVADRELELMEQCGVSDLLEEPYSLAHIRETVDAHVRKMKMGHLFRQTVGWQH